MSSPSSDSGGVGPKLRGSKWTLQTQRLYWLLARLGVKGAHWNLPIGVDDRGELNLVVLESYETE